MLKLAAIILCFICTLSLSKVQRTSKAQNALKVSKKLFDHANKNIPAK